MSDRLAELRRQRALVQEQLNWLDAEIRAAEQRSPSVAPVVTPAPPSPPPAPKPPASAPVALVGTPPAPASAIDAMADAMLEEYKIPPKALHTGVKKGCLLYFAGALVLLILGVAVLYLALRRN